MFWESSPSGAAIFRLVHGSPVGQPWQANLAIGSYSRISWNRQNESLNLYTSHMTTLLLCICVFYTCVKVHTVSWSSLLISVQPLLVPSDPHTPPSSSYRVCSSWIRSACLSFWTDGPVSVVQLWRQAPQIQPVVGFRDGSCPGTVSRS